jgi:hypothetical protein
MLAVAITLQRKERRREERQEGRRAGRRAGRKGGRQEGRKEGRCRIRVEVDVQSEGVEKLLGYSGKFMHVNICMYKYNMYVA